MITIHVSQKTLARVRGVSAELAEAPDHATLVRTVFSRITDLIPGEAIGYSQFDPRHGVAEAGSTTPATWFNPIPVPELGRLMRQHPGAQHFLATGDLRPVRLSEVVRWHDWVRTAAFAEMISLLKTPHQVVIPMSVMPMTAFTINRGGRDFSDAERDTAEVLQLVLQAEHRRSMGRSRHRSVQGAPTVQLTPREREVLALLATGRTAQAIGRETGISHRTVRKHLENAYAKLGVHDRLQAVELARDLGILDWPPGDRG